ncbi:MAG: MBOAT family O-acyltransferase [Nannocystaceae bacterium]
MLFNSLDFLWFFPAAVGAYYAVAPKRRWIVLLTSSYLFYMWWRVDFAVLIFGSTVVDYIAAGTIASSEGKRKRRLLLGVSLATNLGLLFIFKYLGWATKEFHEIARSVVPSADPPILEFMLPVGISFYTFQTLSYTIDVYRGKLQPERHFGRFAVFVAFWPQLVAGPIERATHLIPQLRKGSPWNSEMAISGFRQVVWGMFKKVVVADRLAIYVDTVYGAPENYGGWALLAATYFFAFQIYADFSGYSDIAIGSSKILGIDLMQNFRRPYFALSMGEFWRRWHISLSTWFRDYVYIPLGGNRTSRGRWYLNILIVFVVSGLWHGANWTFLVWGAVHGGVLIIEATLQRYRFAHAVRNLRWLHGVRLLVTFHLALAAWVFFRADSLSDAGVVITGIVRDLPGLVQAVSASDIRALYSTIVVEAGFTAYRFCVAVAGVVVLLVVDTAAERGWHLPHTRLSRYAPLLALDTAVIATLLYGAFGRQSFIYFQF